MNHMRIPSLNSRPTTSLDRERGRVDNGLSTRSISAYRPTDPVCCIPSRQLLRPEPQDDIPCRMVNPPCLPGESSSCRRQRSTETSSCSSHHDNDNDNEET